MLANSLADGVTPADVWAVLIPIGIIIVFLRWVPFAATKRLRTRGSSTTSAHPCPSASWSSSWSTRSSANARRRAGSWRQGSLS